MKHLLLKSIAGMLNLALFMAAALLLPAMSFRYPLAWIYLAAFFVPVIVITVYIFLYDKRLLQSRLSVGPVAETRPTQKAIQGVAGVMFIGVFVLSSFDHRFGWSDVPLWLSYAADAGVVLSFIMLFFVFRQNTFLSATIEVKQNQRVVSTGLYGVVRHPMYSGASAMLLFTPLALGSLWGLIPVSVLMVVIALRAIDEERELKTSLPGYEEYCRKVRWRMIPHIF